MLRTVYKHTELQRILFLRVESVNAHKHFISFQWSTAKIAIKKTSHHTQIQASSFSRVCCVVYMYYFYIVQLQSLFDKDLKTFIQPHSDELNVVFSEYSGTKNIRPFHMYKLNFEAPINLYSVLLFSILIYDLSLRIE